MTLQHTARFRAGLPLAELVDDEMAPEILAEAARNAAETLARCKAERREAIVLSWDEMLIRRIAAQVGAQAVTIMTGEDFARTE